MPAQTIAQRIEYLRGHIDALAWDIRQATADQDRHGVGIITQRREELIAEYDQLIVSPPDLVS